MKNLFKKLFIASACAGALIGTGSLFGLAAVPAARAVDISVSPTLPGSNSSNGSSPAGWVANFYNFALLISGVLAFGAVVYGGVLYLTSAGNPSRQGEGKEWIESALIGILLLAGAYLILQIVNPAIVNINNALPSNLPAINTQPNQ